MPLYEIVSRLASLFDTQQITFPPGFVLGFTMTADQPEFCSLCQRDGGVKVIAGIEDASVVISGLPETYERLESVLTRPDQVVQASALDFVSSFKVLPPEYHARVVHFFESELGWTNNSSPPEYKGFLTPPLRYPVAESPFLTRQYTPDPLPTYDPEALPQLIVDDHPTWCAMYQRAWELAFRNLRQPEPNSGFVANFIDTAFNDNTFMWDSCFMALFGHYGRRHFPFIGTLDNFYAKQRSDGFICREINTYDGRDIFTAHDPSATGPNILAWTEWLDFEQTGDIDRLRAVFPALVGYHRWLRDWQTWPDGSYFTTGWGSGMDNQTRVPDSMHHHRHYSWVDANMQQALNCRILQQMGRVLERREFEAELQQEYDHLKTYINTRMWDEESGFYYDVAPDGSLSQVKTIGAYWGLWAGVVPPDRAARIIAHLEDPALFNRPHRIPSQAADSDGYDPTGAYWRGGVWPPTNYMVLRALTRHGYDDLAYAIARNHVENVAQVFAETGTLWENYAPEQAAPGIPAKPDFVGWTGISAINVPLEYLIGLRPDLAHNTLLWDIRLTEHHGVYRYPFGDTGVLDLICEARDNPAVPPQLTVTTNVPLSLEVRWSQGRQIWALDQGTHPLRLAE